MSSQEKSQTEWKKQQQQSSVLFFHSLGFFTLNYYTYYYFKICLRAINMPASGVCEYVFFFISFYNK